MKLVTADEMARILGVTARAVRRMANEKVIPYHRVGRYLRFDPIEVLKSTSVAV